MMDLTGVRQVQARIAQLQEQFGMPGNIPGMSAVACSTEGG